MAIMILFVDAKSYIGFTQILNFMYFVTMFFRDVCTGYF